MSRVTLRRVLALALLSVTIGLIVVGCSSEANHDTSARAPGGLFPFNAVSDTRTLTTGIRKTLNASSDSVIDGTQPTDEVWVIAQPQDDTRNARVQREEEPAPDAVADRAIRQAGTGVLAAKLPDQQQFIPLPLKHTSVAAQVDAYISTVDVTQQFHNPYDAKIEAVYVFPLPQNAAVSDFVMTIGDRRIRGIIRPRKEAEAIYLEARRQGYTASLLTQERPNIFTQRVANIEPGKAIDVNIRYYNTLAYADGWYEFVFPMVVGPRYNPAGAADPIEPVTRAEASTPNPANTTRVPYLKPTERSGHDISLDLTVNAGVPIEQVECTSHAIDQSFAAPDTLKVSLSERDRVPNKDFVLRFRVTGEQMKTGLLVQRDTRRGHENEGYFTLMLYPPRDLDRLDRAPLEMIFVLDCSGSMSGQPLNQSKDAMHYALSQMRPTDTFQVIRFSNNASQLGARPLPATEANIARGRSYIASLSGTGGTEMIEGIKAALDFPHDPERLRVVAFLTDGYIGNEAEILGEVHNRIGASRVFSFGVGSSPNRYLLDRMAKLGRGAVAYLGLGDDATRVMEQYFERTSHPALTDVTINWGGAKVDGVFPRATPDVFVGRPVVLTGRYVGAPPMEVSVKGRAGGDDVSYAVRAKLQAAATGEPNAVGSLAAVWARMQIADIMDQATFTNDPQRELADEVKRIALEYGLMSAYTAFVAVDSAHRTEGGEGTTIPVPVPVPAGVKYETTVPSTEAESRPTVAEQTTDQGVR